MASRKLGRRTYSTNIAVAMVISPPMMTSIAPIFVAAILALPGAHFCRALCGRSGAFVPKCRRYSVAQLHLPCVLHGQPQAHGLGDGH